jgi:hypothetical protein
LSTLVSEVCLVALTRVTTIDQTPGQVKGLQPSETLEIHAKNQKQYNQARSWSLPGNTSAIYALAKKAVTAITPKRKILRILAAFSQGLSKDIGFIRPLSSERLRGGGLGRRMRGKFLASSLGKHGPPV